MVVEVSDLSSIQKGNVLVDFYTTSCGPCRAMHPMLEEMSKEFQNVTIAKVEVTKNPLASQMFGVMSVPTMMVLKDSKVREVSMGFSDKKKIRSLLEKHFR